VVYGRSGAVARSLPTGHHACVRARPSSCVVAVLSLAAACSSSTNRDAAQPTSTTSRSTPTVALQLRHSRRARARPLQRCGSAQLNASFEYGGAGQSHWGDYFVFTNHGRTCVLAGYARVSARTAMSRWMPLPANEAVGYIPAPKSTGPLAQGGSARILLQGSESERLRHTGRAGSGRVRLSERAAATAGLPRVFDSCCRANAYRSRSRSLRSSSAGAT
jgi:hypothetical protein